MFVVVYGTLKRGYGNNRRLSNAKFVGECTVAGYKLYNAGFPVSRPSEGDSITGEVWDISKCPLGNDHDDQTRDAILRGLDNLEGYYGEGNRNNMYDRVPVVAEGDLGSVQGHMYVGNEDTWDYTRLGECPSVDRLYTWSR